MENKSLIEKRRELLLALRDVVNSEPEYEYIESELAALSPSFSLEVSA